MINGETDAGWMDGWMTDEEMHGGIVKERSRGRENRVACPSGV